MGYHFLTGPLSENWLEEYTNDYLKSVQAGVKPKNSMMCAYKLCKVNVNLWAMRARIEKFIDDIGKIYFLEFLITFFFYFLILNLINFLK